MQMIVLKTGCLNNECIQIITIKTRKYRNIDNECLYSKCISNVCLYFIDIETRAL